MAGVKLAPTQQMQCSIVGSQCLRGSEVARYLVERKVSFRRRGWRLRCLVAGGLPPPRRRPSPEKRRRKRSAAQNKWNSSNPIENGPQCNRHAMGPALVATTQPENRQAGPPARGPNVGFDLGPLTPAPIASSCSGRTEEAHQAFHQISPPTRTGRQAGRLHRHLRAPVRTLPRVEVASDELEEVRIFNCPTLASKSPGHDLSMYLDCY